ncbi:MAG: acetylglutamate kinase [Alphaproteobacteria bacterium]|nr:acetylglutamate kinase [Alphaproteobacteria bacterium]
MAETPITSSALRSDWLAKAEVLTEALPFMRRYSGHRIVVKFGGHAMGEAESIQSFANDMVLLNQVGACPVVVHGGGPQIGAMLNKLDIQSEFINGLRVTDAETVNVVEMVLCGAINKSLVGALQQAGGSAVGISGKDSGLITARKISTAKGGSNIEEAVDLGFVGEPDHIDTRVVDALISAGMTPVIAPVAPATDGATYNINADTAAGAISAAMGATRLLMLTDVSGVLNKDGEHIQKLKITQARALIADGTINGGMIPKVETCIDAVEGGAEAAVILDGREPHAVLVELFTEHGIGTIITKD